MCGHHVKYDFTQLQKSFFFSVCLFFIFPVTSPRQLTIFTLIQQETQPNSIQLHNRQLRIITKHKVWHHQGTNQIRKAMAFWELFSTGFLSTIVQIWIHLRGAQTLIIATHHMKWRLRISKISLLFQLEMIHHQILLLLWKLSQIFSCPTFPYYWMVGRIQFQDS